LIYVNRGPALPAMLRAPPDLPVARPLIRIKAASSRIARLHLHYTINVDLKEVAMYKNILGRVNNHANQMYAHTRLSMEQKLRASFS
jgi:hypothetical protein